MANLNKPPSTPSESTAVPSAPSERFLKSDDDGHLNLPKVPSGILDGGSETQEATQQLLEKMKPYLKNVFVVSPAKDGMPAILSGKGVESAVKLPENLPQMPGERWTVTPKIEKWHQTLAASKTNDEWRNENTELKNFVAPVLEKRYGEQAGLVAVELGPATSTDLASVFDDDDTYFGMDLSLPFLQKARELHNEPGYKIADAFQVQGDTYRMPFEDNVADVVCVSCHNPLFSAEPADKIRALAEVKRVLKPGGEFALFPWDPDKKSPEVREFLNSQFELIETHSQHPGRNLLILKARESQKA